MEIPQGQAELLARAGILLTHHQAQLLGAGRETIEVLDALVNQR